VIGRPSGVGRDGALAHTWAAALGVSAGAAVGATFSLSSAAALIATGACGLALRRRPLASLAGVALVGVGASALGASARADADSVLSAIAQRAPRCYIDGRVVEQLGGLGTLVEIETARCPGLAVIASAGPVAADLPSAPAGAAVEGEGWLVPLGDDRFDTQRRRLGALARFRAREMNVGNVRGVLATVASTIRASLHTAASRFDDARSALLRGLVIGDTSGMDARTEETLRRAGLSHLVAVSGSNVAIVLVAIAAITRRFALVHRVALAGIGLTLYVAVVGPEPSVLRAAAMGAIGLAAMASGVRAEPLQALGLAVIVIVVLRPGIIFSVGLHLSVAATCGIVLWTRPIRSKLVFLPSAISTILAATVAAQLAVAPVVVLVFGELSIVSPLANLMAAPAVPLATVAGLAAALAGIALPALGSVGANVAAPAVAWILHVGRVLGSPEWATITLPNGMAWVIAAPVAGAAIAAIRARR
jgi:competence protein ComEC